MGRDLQKRAFLLPWVVALAALAATISVFIDVRLLLREKREILFGQQVEIVHSKIMERIRSHENLLLGTRNFFASGVSFHQGTWRRYQQSLFVKEKFPALQEMEYVGKTSASFPHPALQKAAHLSRDTGRHVFSSPVSFGRETALKPAFYQVMPVYPGNVIVEEMTVFERRGKLKGWVYGLFVAENLFQDVADPAAPKINFSVYDGLEPRAESLIFSGFSDSAPSALEEAAVLPMGGRFWTVLFRSHPSFPGMAPLNRSHFLLGIGIVLSGLLFFLLRRLLGKWERDSGRLSAVLKTTEEAIIVEQLDGTIIGWNAGAEKIYGYTAYETAGKSISLVIPKDRPHELSGILNKIRHGMAVNHHETKHVRKDGRRVDILLMASPVRNAKGDVAGLLMVARNETAIREGKALLDRQVRMFEETKKELEHSAPRYFARPAAKIIAFSARLQKHSSHLNAEERNYLDRLHGSAMQLRKILERLAAFSRISTRMGALETVDLKEIVREAVSDLEMHLARRRGRVEIGSLPAVKADPVRMRQLFQTLIMNALRFARKGEDFHIRIESSLLENGLVQIRLNDNGMGVDEKAIERLFHPFEANNYGGEQEEMTWGFAICRKIVVNHGGELALKSVPNRGSSVIITLPMV